MAPASLHGLFRRGRPAAAEALRLREAATRIKERVASRLDLAATDAVSVNEILCPDPACPDLETIILVMSPRRATRAFKVRKPLGEVGDDDVDLVLSGLPGA